MSTGRPTGRPRKVKTTEEQFLESKIDEDKSIPPFPEGLTDDGENMWIKIWATCDWLEEADGFLVTELCQTFQDKELYRRALALGDVPRTYRLSNKTVVPHPYVKMLADARVQMNSYFTALGFSPEARSKIGALEGMVAGDPIVELLKTKMKREAARRGEADG